MHDIVQPEGETTHPEDANVVVRERREEALKIAERLRNVKHPEPLYRNGVLAKYASMVSSASDGSITRPLR